MSFSTPRPINNRKQLVAAEIDNALREVPVPDSIKSLWENEDIIKVAHLAAKEDVVTGTVSTKEFSKSVAIVKNITSVEATAQIRDMLLTVDPVSGAAVYGTGTGTDTEYFVRVKRSKLSSSCMRAIYIKPKGKIHFFCQGDTEFARDLRDYMISCTKRVKELENDCAAYELELNKKNKESITEHAEIKKVLMAKRMSEADAKGVNLLVDRMVTYPLLLGNGENGIHNGIESVKNAGAAAKTVKAMTGTVTIISVNKKGRVNNCSAGLNLMAKTQHKETRESIANMFKRCTGAITKERAINLLKRYRSQHSTKFLELDPNSDDPNAWLSAEEQAKAKFDSHDDRRLDSPLPLVAIPATPVWAAQQGLR